MARRNTTEAPVEEQVTEEGTVATPEQEQGTTEAVVDLTGFKSAVETAVAERDDSTGEVPLASIEPVNVEYRKLDGIKPKNAAKGWLEDEMKSAITKLDAQLARAYSTVRDNLSAGSGTKAERQPVDPTAAFVNKLASVKLAEQVLGLNLPEGVDAEAATKEAQNLADSLYEQVTAYQTWVTTEVPEGEEKPEAPEVSPVVRTAFKLAAGKASGGGRVSGGSGVRRDISKHIQSAFADLEDGAFLTIAQIANHTSEEYGEDHPSQGAVSARIFPSNGGETTVPGVRKQAAEGDQPRGAVKDASKS